MQLVEVKWHIIYREQKSHLYWEWHHQYNGQKTSYRVDYRRNAAPI